MSAPKKPDLWYVVRISNYDDPAVADVRLNTRALPCSTARVIALLLNAAEPEDEIYYWVARRVIF
jgi:hypothetical protein